MKKGLNYRYREILKDPTSYYVRPSGGSYGNEDGSDYDNAWDGFTNIDWTDFGPGDTLWVCGTNTEILTVATVDGNPNDPFFIRGDYPGDAAIIDGEDTRDYGIHIAGRDWITVKNIIVTQAGSGGANGQGLKVDNGDYIVAQNVTATDCYWDGISFEQCRNCTIEYCTATGNSVRGITISGSAGASTNVRVLNCTATGNGRRGFTIGGAAATQNVTNCIFQSCTSSGNGQGFEIGLSENCSIIECSSTAETLSTLDPGNGETFTCVEVYRSKGTQVLRNTLNGNTNTAAYVIHLIGHATYTADDTRIMGNYITSGKDYAIYTNDTNISNLWMVGNVFDTCPRGIRAINNTGCVFANNIIVATTEAFRAQSQITGGNAKVINNIFLGDAGTNGWVYDVPGNSTFTIDNNCYDDPTPDSVKWVVYNGTAYGGSGGAAITGIDAAAIEADPLFINEGARDYRLTSLSTLKAAGDAWWTTEIPRDRDNKDFSAEPNTSVGAYQYGL